MAAEAAGRDDATAGPADCTEMGERVRCLFCLFSFFFSIISDAVFAETDRIEERPAPPGLCLSPGCGTAAAAAAEMERNSAALTQSCCSSPARLSVK